jgi:two-component system NarL family response regulator
MTSAGAKIRVLVADDHPITRDGLTVMIDGTPDMTVVAEAADGLAAVERYREHRPDVAILDLRMPALTGSEATVAILQEFPDARILVLSAIDGDEAIYRALQAGARGYLLKDLGREELLEAIRAVHAGARRTPRAVAARLAERLVGSELTPREAEVLALIAQGRSNRAIAEALSLTELSVKTYVSTILDKLGVADRTQALTTAIRRGIVPLDGVE